MAVPPTKVWRAPAVWATILTMTERSEPADVDDLRAERDALAARVAELEQRRGIGVRLRRLAAPVLVVLFAISFLAAGLGVWLDRSTMNDDVWAERVVPLGEDPAVQAALAAWTTNELMQTVDPKALFQEVLPERGAILAVPLTAAVESFVRDVTDDFFASERFEELWATAAVNAHEAAVATLRGERPAVEADDEKVTINLVPLVNAVLAQILDAAPGLVGSDVDLPDVTVDDLPAEARTKLADALGIDLDGDFGTITVYDGGKLSAAQQAVRQFDRLVVLSCVLTIVFAVAALWVSPRRRRTLLQMVGAAAFVVVLVRRAAFTLQDDVTGLVRVEENRAATRVIVASFVNPLTDATVGVLWLLAIIAVVAAVTGPYPWARRLRRGTSELATRVGSGIEEQGQRTGATAWMVDHADALKLVGYGAGMAVLWIADASWWLLAVVLAIAIAWHVLIDRLAAATSGGGEAPPVVPGG